MKVKKLIETLSSVNPELDIFVEGCDCTGTCVGVSVGTDAYKNAIIIRRDNGVMGDEEGILGYEPKPKEEWELED